MQNTMLVEDVEELVDMVKFCKNGLKQDAFEQDVASDLSDYITLGRSYVSKIAILLTPEQFVEFVSKLEARG